MVQSGPGKQPVASQTNACEVVQPPIKEDLELTELSSLKFTMQRSPKKLIETPPMQHIQTPLQKARTQIEECFGLTIPHRKTINGTKGHPIQIESNHLALNFRKLDRAVHYVVAITPSTPKTPKKLFRRIMEEFRSMNYSNRHPAFDGAMNLYSSSELPFGIQINRDVIIYDDKKPRQYKVAIKFANFVDFTLLTKFMTANPNGILQMVTPHEVIQCLDIIFCSAPALAYQPVGRSYFTPPRDQILSLGNGIEMYYGFHQLVIMGWKPYLNIDFDFAHKVISKRQNVIDLILDICKVRREDLQKPLYKNQKDDVDHFLRTLKVSYEIPGIKRSYRVNSLDKSATEATFRSNSVSEITVEKHFFKEKNIVLKYPHMPCLWVGKKDRVSHLLLPAEFCSVIEGQVINSKHSEKLTSTMIKQAASSIEVMKEKTMMSPVREMSFNKNLCVREFEINVREELMKKNGRMLKPPAHAYNGKSVVKPTQGAWRPNKFLSGVTLREWTIINLEKVICTQLLEEMVKLMCDQSASLGMTISQPQRPFQMLQLRHMKELQELEKVFKKKKDLQLIIVVVPHTGPLYSYVKQAAELSVGCLTQCISSRTICQMNVSVIFNILQKVNAKLEGINYILNDRMELMKRPYMVMGADVAHPSPDSKDKPSVATVTASYDPVAFKYNLCWRLQPPMVEIIEELEDIMREQLRNFYTSTKYKPERIIFFRNIVSEGQFEYILNTEIQSIRRACTSMQPDGTYKPKITILFVKLDHTRFVPVNHQDASKDKNLNVPVGTCVDTEITHFMGSNFILVWHFSIHRARSTKYRVLWDDADMSLDDLQQLTFYFCHMFSRCLRSINYPAPTCYAHLAAARIMTYCESERLDMNNLAEEQDRLSIKWNIIKN